jgi:methyl-accepting chemotaxis protein
MTMGPSGPHLTRNDTNMAVIDSPRPQVASQRHVEPAPSADALRPPGLGVRGLFWLLTTILVAYAISIAVRPNGQTWTWLDGWGVCAFELLCSVLVLLRGLRRPADRRFTLWLGLGCCAWALGDVAMTVESLHGVDPATPSLANYVWVGFFPLAYVGVMLLMERDVRRFTAANYLDGVVACLVTASALVAFAFHDIQSAAGASSVEVAWNLIYPVGDLLLFALTVLAIVLAAPGRRRAWYLIAAAGLFNVGGDVSALFSGIDATHVGFFLDSDAWPASLLCISAAVWLPTGVPGEVRDARSSGFLVPAVASGLALAILFVASLQHTSQVAVFLAMATLLAAGVRFGLALRRLKALTEERHRELQGAAAGERGSREALQAAVRSYSQFAARVADGDLTASVSADGGTDLRELSRSLNTMVGGLAEISGEIQAGVEEIGGSTTEILASVSRHTDSAAEQSAAISQTTATVGELRSMADETALRAREVATQAQASVQVSDEGTAAVAELADAMEEIRARVDGIAQGILTFSERTRQIGAITDTVNELADRSRLLALNAGIEAARAGEHGRGFSVVAEHVRELAEQSRAATAQVETILVDIREATNAAVVASEEGTRVVDRGLALTSRAGEGISSLADTIREASSAAEQIAGSAHQQSVGMDEIAGAMSDIDRGTGQSLEGARQSQVAAESLDELSAKLASLVARYRVS